MADWSELPIELLDLIGTRFDNSSDTRRFRSVCSSWRYSIPSLEPKKALNNFSPIKYLSSKVYHCDLRIVKRTIFCLSHPSKPNASWLIMAEESKPGLFRLCSPFASTTCTKNMYIKTLDLTHVDIMEVDYEYVLRNVTGDMHLYNMEHEKVAVFNFDTNNVDNYIIFSTHNTSGKLLMYRSSVQEWAFLEDEALGYDDRSIFAYWSLRYVDVAFHDGRFYAVTDSGRTVVIEIGEDSSVVVTMLMKSMIGGDKKCLVKSADDLLLMDLYMCPSLEYIEINAIEVYKLDKEQHKWVLLTESLGNRSIFLSNHTSFSASNLKGFEENCIYFHFKNSEQDTYDDENDDWLEFDKIGVFDYGKGTFKSGKECLEGVEFCHWPIPSWIIDN